MSRRKRERGRWRVIERGRHSGGCGSTKKKRGIKIGKKRGGKRKREEGNELERKREGKERSNRIRRREALQRQRLEEERIRRVVTRG